MPKIKQQPTKAILYARFSPRPDERVKATDSNEYQLDACRAYCKARDYEIIATHEDKEASGIATDRPGLQQAIEDACDCKGVLVAYSVSRIARSVKGVFDIVDTLKKNGAHIAMLDMNVDTTTALGSFFLAITAAYADLERHQTSERTSAAMRTYQGYGRAISSNPPFGWRFSDVSTNGRRTIEADPAEQIVLSRIIKLVNGGMTPNRVCTVLNAEGITARRGKWQPLKVLRIMRRHEDGYLQPVASD